MLASPLRVVSLHMFVRTNGVRGVLRGRFGTYRLQRIIELCLCHLAKLHEAETGFFLAVAQIHHFASRR